MNTPAPQCLDLATLQRAVAHAAAFRFRRRLQPAGGAGDKVFPPTFSGAVYASEKRRVPQRVDPVDCVLLDSVQSQANRMEAALQDAVDAGLIELPVLSLDFGPYAPTGDIEADKSEGRLIDALGKITSLQAPHRIADALLRDSEVEEAGKKVAFRQSSKGKALNTVSVANATALFELCPTALVFGVWDSTGPKGGLGPKFERAMVSEVVGIGAENGDLLRGVRRDPIEARSKVPILKTAGGEWTIATDPKAKNVVAPSEVNHGSVPYPKDREKKTADNRFSGVTIEYAEQITTLSLIVLRRLRFPVAGSAADKDIDAAARTVLAALGLCAAALAFESGMGLRSRCLLWPEQPLTWELLATPGEPPATFALTSADAVALLNEAVAAAKARKLPWLSEPLVLKPSARLLDLARQSQDLATKAEDTKD
ncbi:MAG: type I-U CRISPR-associated RAMP protein Csb1/Cas7u [Candidatus Methylacidiphilales bacterium]